MNTLEIALTPCGQFVWVIYGNMTVAMHAARWRMGAGYSDYPYSVARHEDPMMARIVFDWATKAN